MMIALDFLLVIYRLSKHCCRSWAQLNGCLITIPSGHFRPRSSGERVGVKLDERPSAGSYRLLRLEVVPERDIPIILQPQDRFC